MNIVSLCGLLGGLSEKVSEKVPSTFLDSMHVSVSIRQANYHVPLLSTFIGHTKASLERFMKK